MLECLGPEAIRRLAAHNELKRIKQRQDQDPNLLLAKLNALWSELGEVSEEQRRMDFMSSLLMDIQKELLLRDPKEFDTVTKLNTMARFYWNKNKRNAATSDYHTQKKEVHTQTPHEEHAGPPQTRKKAKRAFPPKADKKQGKSDRNGPKDSNMVCWVCNKPGHRQRHCPKAKEAPKVPSNPKSGKDSGQKN
jgi:hypothetical protein